MTKITKQCRICGKTYTPCGYCEGDKMAFHYRTICCSRECAKIYLARVLEARGRLKDSTPITQENSEPEKSEVSSEELNQAENAPEVSDTLSTEENEEAAAVVTRKRRRSTKDTENATTEQINE